MPESEFAPEDLERMFRGFLADGDAKGVEAALTALAAQDPHRARELFDSAAAALAVARGASTALTFAEAVGEVERYCITSGRPVHMIPGDRCLAHGDAPTPCSTDVRPAQCSHPKLSSNHPYPHCSECGKDLPGEDT